MMEVYFDNAATTKPDPRVVEKMTKFLKEDFGNPSSTHKFGRKARVAVEESREIIAEFLNADPSEIYFTSSGTEADNMALFGIAKTESKESGRNKIIATAGDHHAVIESIERLSEEGFQTELIPLRKDSSVDLESLSETIDKGTSLISAIHYNNETGVINPIEEISNMKNEHAFYFHTDAVQSFGKTKIDVRKFNLDALSFSGHKIHGPKGIG
ncbi:MAG: aminotransferase class V-fold PLP-dependent enzyme, partial [Ignavibacteria bacterium]